MKICPKCKAQFEDDLNFCLRDGTTLKDFDAFNPGDGVSDADHATLKYRGQPTENQNQQTLPMQFPQSPQYTNKSNSLWIFGGILGLILLLIGTMVGAYLYLRRPPIDNWYPTPTPYQGATPYRTPTPANNIKVEILDKVNGSFGQKYLKCKVTNTGENIIASPSISLSFYQNDVKIKDASASSELKFLKPNQTVPVWVNLYGVDKYTSVKVKEPVTARVVSQSEEKVFPKLIFTDIAMTGEKGGLSYNFQSYTKIYYKIRGIVETESDMKSTIVLFVLYKDENSEIVGVGNTRLSDLKAGEKSKFEVSECEIDLFGTPKTFEIIAVDDSIY
jgi:hypothetical protein